MMKSNKIMLLTRLSLGLARARTASLPRMVVGIGLRSGEEAVSSAGETSFSRAQISSQDASGTQRRNFSSKVNTRIQRAFPQYSVHGESNMLTVKMIVPGYRLVKGDSLVVDTARKGRLLFEFTPRGSEGGYIWNDQARFALSAEEVGLFCNQLPQFEIELSRSSNVAASADEENMRFGPITNDMPEKVLRVTPGEGGTVNFQLDYVKDGIGGQSPGVGQDGSGAMEVSVQAGEFEVILSIMRTSLPVLAGWSPLIDIAVQASINDAVRGGGGYSGPTPSNGGKFSSGGWGQGGHVPF